MAYAHDLADVLAVFEAVARKSIERHQSFDEHILQLDEESKTSGGNNQRVELIADPVDHELDLLPLDQLPFGLRRPALGV